MGVIGFEVGITAIAKGFEEVIVKCLVVNEFIGWFWVGVGREKFIYGICSCKKGMVQNFKGKEATTNNVRLDYVTCLCFLSAQPFCWWVCR